MPPGGIRIHDTTKQVAVELRLRPRGHWDRLVMVLDDFIFHFFLSLHNQNICLENTIFIFLFILVVKILLLNNRYNSCTVLSFSTVFFHSWRSCACSVHLKSFFFLRSFLTSSYHLLLGLPTGRVIYGCHLYIFFTMLISGFLYMCPYQLGI
jgi:hypothetical protein